MHPRLTQVVTRSLTIVAAAAFIAACADDAPLAPGRAPTAATRSAMTDEAALVQTLRRATARYHDLAQAERDGFTLLHECEVRPGEGTVGMVYVHFGRVLDGVIDPESPDALVYEPSADGKPKLVAAEFAVLNTGQPAPQFMGATFQAEEEFGVYGLHAWVWRENPEGLFAEANSRVSCGAA
jgi:hypothetical protein